MSNFYGTVRGSGGEAHRAGGHTLHVSAQSYAGDIGVTMHRGADGVDRMTISIREHEGVWQVPLYVGTIKDLLNMEKRAAQMHLLGVQKFTEGHDNA